jgi:dihydropteridine reductase
MYIVRLILTSYSIKLILNTFLGGWAGGSADSSDFIKNADLMWKQSVWSSGISAALAAHHLKPGGCIVLPGEHQKIA